MNPSLIVRGCAVAAACLLAAAAMPGPAGRSPAAPSGLLGCSPDCEGAIPENETCGLDANNGCHGSGLFGNVYCGKPVCGELSVDKNGGVFDVDWFTLDISYYTTLVKITASVGAEMPVDLYIVDANCNTPTILTEGTGICPKTATVCLAPGIYRVLLVPAALDGYPCGSPNRRYRLDVACEPAATVCCDDDAMPTTANGDPVLPPGWDGSAPLYIDIDQDRGRVADLYPGLNTSLDTWYDQMPCDPTIGDFVPREADADDLPGELADLGIEGDPDAVLADLEAAEDAIADKVMLEANLLLAAPPVTPGPFVPGGPHCPPAGNQYIYGGRDIILIHGLRLEHLVDRFVGTPGAEAEWHPPSIFPASTENPQFYGGGYFKHRAEVNWEDYVHNFLEANHIKNRYLIVCYPSTQRLDVAVQAVLTQIADAMRDGTGVVDPSSCDDKTNFGTPSFVIMSHSTGALVTDVAMSAAAAYPGLGAGFIPQQCKAHIAPSGAFLGSHMATAAVALSGFAPGGNLGAAGCLLAKLQLSDLDPDVLLPGCAASGTDMHHFAQQLVRNSILVDLVPKASQGRWGSYIASTPVRTITAVASHPTKAKPMKYWLHRGFDDGVVTVNSQVPSPNPVQNGASAFWPQSIRETYDIGMDEAYFAEKRAKGYRRDQVKDLRLPQGAVASAAIRWLSPTGMLEPQVQFTVPGLDPHARYPNHFTFLQSASSHKSAIRTLNQYPYYEHTDNGSELNWEETRVLTDPAVYASYAAGMGDVAPLLSETCMKPMREEVLGRKIRFSIRIFGKTFAWERWMWRRAYHRLESSRLWHQIDYIHHSVLCAPIDCNGVLCDASPDFNGDGVIDAADLGLLLGWWGADFGGNGDLNRDGIVDGADLGVLLGHWGQGR